MRRRKSPLRITLPPCGVLAAESLHGHGFSMAEDRHPFHELFFVYRGSLKFHVDSVQDPVFMTEGSVLPIRSDSAHRVEDVAEVTLLILALSGAFVSGNPFRASLWRDLLRRRPLALRPDETGRQRIERCFQTILAEQATPRVGSESVIQSEASHILVALARLPLTCHESNSHTRVESVIRALEETYYEDWSIDEAARRAHLSRRRFTMIFRELTGKGLLEHRNDLRLDQAARLIRDYGATIAGAAFSSGFQDLAHFYRLFRRRFGKPPGEWARDNADPAKLCTHIVPPDGPP